MPAEVQTAPSRTKMRSGSSRTVGIAPGEIAGCGSSGWSRAGRRAGRPRRARRRPSRRWRRAAAVAPPRARSRRVAGSRNACARAVAAGDDQRVERRRRGERLGLHRRAGRTGDRVRALSRARRGDRRRRDSAPRSRTRRSARRRRGSGSPGKIRKPIARLVMAENEGTLSFPPDASAGMLAASIHQGDAAWPSRFRHRRSDLSRHDPARLHRPAHGVLPHPRRRRSIVASAAGGAIETDGGLIFAGHDAAGRDRALRPAVRPRRPGGDRRHATTRPSWREVRRLAAGARYLTSVCTGSLILGATGLLKGKRAACHWAWRDMLPLFGAIPDESRVVRDGNIITGGGVTAGIDFALVVAAELAGDAFAQALQLGLEYAPRRRSTPAARRPRRPRCSPRCRRGWRPSFRSGAPRLRLPLPGSEQDVCAAARDVLGRSGARLCPAPSSPRSYGRHAQLPHRHRHRLRRRSRDHHGALRAGRARPGADDRRRQCRPRAGDAERAAHRRHLRLGRPRLHGRAGAAHPDAARGRALVSWERRSRRPRLSRPRRAPEREHAVDAILRHRS